MKSRLVKRYVQGNPKILRRVDRHTRKKVGRSHQKVQRLIDKIGK